MGLWKSIKNAAKSVGKFVKKNWKVIVGVAAAVAVPFVAPMIGSALAGSAFLNSVAPSVATFLGTAGGKALIGAGLGAVASGATGGNPLLGAALGGVGAYGVAGGFNGMFGGIGGGAAGAPAATTPALGAGGAVTGGQGIVALGGTGAATAASSGIGSAITGTIGSLATKLATNPQAIGALSQLAMTMFNKDMGELTKEERAQLEEAAKQAGTDRALFEQKVMEARKVINMGTPNPEQAYANARFAVENQMADVRRGLTPGLQESAERKAAIAGAQSGALGVATDYGAAAQTRQVGLNMMPSGAPTGYNQLAMDTYASVEARRQKLAEQQSKAVGQLFGALA